LVFIIKKKTLLLLWCRYKKKPCQFSEGFLNQYIQGVSRLVDITAGGDFLGLYDKKIHINMCSILGGYGAMGTF